MAHPSYLTYAEYVGYGGSASQTAFPTLEFKARKQIDYLTASRVQNMETVPEAVKLCYGNALSADDTAKQIKKQIEAMLYGETDDNGVPLLYRGVRG